MRLWVVLVLVGLYAGLATGAVAVTHRYAYRVGLVGRDKPSEDMSRAVGISVTFVTALMASFVAIATAGEQARVTRQNITVTLDRAEKNLVTQIDASRNLEEYKLELDRHKAELGALLQKEFEAYKGHLGMELAAYRSLFAAANLYYRAVQIAVGDDGTPGIRLAEANERMFMAESEAPLVEKEYLSLWHQTWQYGLYISKPLLRTIPNADEAMKRWLDNMDEYSRKIDELKEETRTKI